MHDGQTDRWARQWAKEPTVNLFSYVFHILFKKKTFSRCKRNFSHSMGNFFSASQRHPKTVRVILEQLVSSISRICSPKTVTITPKQSVSPFKKFTAALGKSQKKIFS